MTVKTRVLNHKKTIHDLCDKLKMKGVEPKITLLSSLMPEIKSTSTIHKHLLSWKAKTNQEKVEMFDRKFSLSSNFTQAFMDELQLKSTEAELSYKKQFKDANNQRLIAEQELAQFKSDFEALSLEKIANEIRLGQLEEQLLQSREQYLAIEIEAQQNKEAQNKLVNTHTLAVKELQIEVAQLSNKNNAHSRLNHELAEELTSMSALLSDSKALAETLEEENAKIHLTNEELHKQNVRTNAELNSATASLEAKQVEVNELTGIKATLEEELAELNAANESLSETNHKATAELNSATASLEAKQVEVNELAGVKATLEEELAELNAANQSLSETNHKVTAELNSATTSLKAKQVEVNKLAGVKEKLKEELAELNTSNELLENNNKTLTEINDNLTAEREEASFVIAGNNAKPDTVKKAKREVQQELNKLKVSTSNLQDDHANLVAAFKDLSSKYIRLNDILEADDEGIKTLNAENITLINEIESVKAALKETDAKLQDAYTHKMNLLVEVKKQKTAIDLLCKRK